MYLREIFTQSVILFIFPLSLFAQHEETLPNARGRAHLVYHPESKTMLLMDGYSEHLDSTRNDVWKWDGKKWERIIAYGPYSRSGSAAALNTKTNEIVVFGGWGKGGPPTDSRNDTWNFDGLHWNKVETNFIDKHDHHKMVYADHINSFVIYGGFNSTSKTFDSSTWLLRDNVFTPLVIPGPGARGNHGLAYDPVRKKVVLFGAKVYNQPAELWEFDGQKWEQVSVGDIGMTTGHEMVYSQVHEMVIVNGHTGTFGWNGKTMIKIADPGPTGSHTALGYDPKRKVVVAYGGFGNNRSISAALWELKGDKWVKVSENKAGKY